MLKHKSTFKKMGALAPFFCSYRSWPFFCPLATGGAQISLLKIKSMIPQPTIRRNLLLKEYEIKETPTGEQTTFSIKFVKKDGSLVFLPRAVACGLSINMKENRMRGVIPVDIQNDSIGHVTPVHIDGIVCWNGKKVKI